MTNNVLYRPINAATAGTDLEGDILIPVALLKYRMKLLIHS